MIRRRRTSLRPFDAGGRRVIVAIFLTFAAMAGLTFFLTLSATGRLRDRGTLVELAARQRTLAERYLSEVLLRRSGEQADPAAIAAILDESTQALLEGGTAPGVNGDDDETAVSAARGNELRRQLREEAALVSDLTANGEAVLSRAPVSTLPSSGHEHIVTSDPVQRLRVVTALTSAVALNVARTIADSADAGVSSLVVTQVGLIIGGLVVSLLLAAGLIAITRRQTIHFRTLAQSSTDLVAVIGEDGCRYASRSLAAKTGRPEGELLGEGLERFVHEDDRVVLANAASTGEPSAFTFRLRDAAGTWRHLEARATDLRSDRQLRGIVINARDATDRLQLERELSTQAQRDGFASQLSEALEMADEEQEVFDVVERAMLDISEATPMELLLSDSSRANLRRAATHPSAGAPSCPVKSPFSCVAVRRGSAVVFDTSTALNSCPQLRDRPVGACSAVCVPISFMGRSLGVLHTTGPDASPLGSDAVARLSTLASQAGARIGTVRAFEKTQLQASTDGLTGLSNRRTIESQAREVLREGRSFAFVIADLDRFKALNDTHGHEAGDRALRLFAQVTEQAIRDDDLLGRWGGEEFVLVLPDLDRFGALSLLDRLRARLAAAHPGETARFTASFGVADSTQAGTIDEIVKIADMGLYAAKAGGRDRAKIGEPPPATNGAGGDSGDQAEPGEKPPSEPGSRRQRGRATPSLHRAALEEEPPSSGVQIR